MASNHGDLMRHCVNVLNTYNPDDVSLDEHFNRFVKSQQIQDEATQTFVLEVFAGCGRYSSVLTVVTNGFYNRDGKTVLRSEEKTFRVLTYLALFRLDELGMATFRKFVRSQDINKMNKFFTFFLDERNLRTWMKDEWCKLYDGAYVQTTLLSPVIRWLPELNEMLTQIKEQIENKNKLKQSTIPATVPKPFNITKARPRSVPMPMIIPKLQRHSAIPPSTYQKPPEQDVMEQIKVQNRRKAEEKLLEASKQLFACSNPDKSEKTKQKMQAIIQEEESKLDFDRHKSNPMPSVIQDVNIPIKLNTAAIMREGKLYKQREQEEIERLEKLEAGHRDKSEFLEWQTKMRQQDMAQEEAEIERRRLEGKLSHEEAILAKQRLNKENQAKVKQMKQQAAELMEQFMERKLQEEAEMRQVVENVTDTHENAKEAKRKLQEYKARIVQEVTEESREMMRQALEEAEAELKEKMELIRQIRAMEAIPISRFKLVDLSEIAGHGLLSEMSIVELRERIGWLRIQQREEEEEKRDSILNSKQCKDQMLMETLNTITRHRTEQSKAAATRFEERKKARTQKPVITDPKLQELERLVEERKAERMRQQERSKITSSSKSLNRLKELGSSKKLMEEARWSELEQRREKTARLVSTGVIRHQGIGDFERGGKMGRV